jgi:hypothetical protein
VRDDLGIAYNEEYLATNHGRPHFTTERLGEWLTILFRIERSQVQILVQRPVMPPESFSGFPQSFQANAAIVH